jgi:hypothetical protein
MKIELGNTSQVAFRRHEPAVFSSATAQRTRDQWTERGVIVTGKSATYCFLAQLAVFTAGHGFFGSISRTTARQPGLSGVSKVPPHA